ncbi:MAG: 23S rRNA (guanosine(2251)-2'-O)-methyltransferase RlmB [Bacteroidales bacterium]|jgi:23S rRNA (guanosine2251-2'-O)-methyltransferase|nr:23S rRNA (guanosine(2251)-2'-O)-methyltransferase RlmB [Bacteroidales bacterium]
MNTNEYRQTHQQAPKQMIFGLHPVMEALEAGREMNKVLLRRGMEGDSYKRLQALLQRHDIPVQIVPPEKLDRVTRKNHQGVIAFISPVEYARVEHLVPALFESGKNPLIVVCDGITDTRNIGAIARSAECAGAHALLLPAKGSAMLSADAVKTSAGALNHLAVCRTEHLKSTLLFLKNSGLKIIAATEKASVAYHEADLSCPAVLLLGAEDTGISPECLRLADVIVKIPVQGKILSLNVSAAATVLLFEMLRQNTGAKNRQ